MSETTWPGHLRALALHRLGMLRRTEVPPSPPELREGIAAVEAAARPALYGRRGGVRPDPSHDMWGGAGLVPPGAEVPPPPLVHLVTIRLDRLAFRPPALEGLGVLLLWIDPDFGALAMGDGHLVLSAADVDGWEEARPREGMLPSRPVTWLPPRPELPSWEDAAGMVPDRVAWWSESGWFFDHPLKDAAYEAAGVAPLKLGGWPQWIQGKGWHDDPDAFVLQVDDIGEGGVGFGDAGSIYLFRDGGAWDMRGDCH